MTPGRGRVVRESGSYRRVCSAFGDRRAESLLASQSTCCSDARAFFDLRRASLPAVIDVAFRSRLSFWILFNICLYLEIS